jgi:hypothetical protein
MLISHFSLDADTCTGFPRAMETRNTDVNKHELPQQQCRALVTQPRTCRHVPKPVKRYLAVLSLPITLLSVSHDIQRHSKEQLSALTCPLHYLPVPSASRETVDLVSLGVSQQQRLDTRNQMITNDTNQLSVVRAADI